MTTVSKCVNCDSLRLFRFYGNVPDGIDIEYQEVAIDGTYISHALFGTLFAVDVPIIFMEICLDCGRIQEECFPISENDVAGWFLI